MFAMIAEVALHSLTLLRIAPGGIALLLHIDTGWCLLQGNSEHLQFH